VARFKGWQDPPHHMLGPIGGVEEQFCPLPWHLVGGGVKKEIAESHAKVRAPGLSGHYHGGISRQQTTAGQPFAQGLNLGGFSTSIDAFQHHETSPSDHGVMQRMQILPALEAGEH
jgi:hypothetical protein